MENSLRTNRWALISFVSGLTAFLMLGVLLLAAMTAPSRNLPERTVSIMDLSRSVLDLCTFLSLLTGVLALRDIRRNGDIEKGRTLAWLGMALGAGGRSLIALYFLLGTLFSLR